MREIIDREMLVLLEGLYGTLVTELSVFLSDAQALCAVCMLLYFGSRSYSMLSGDERWEIMPLLRPFALGMVIIFWPQFIGILNLPGEVISDRASVLLRDRIDEIDAIQIERQQKVTEMSRRLIEQSAEMEQLSDAGKEEDWMSTLGIDFSDMFDQIKGFYLLVQSKFRWLLMDVIEFMGITFYQVCSYLIYFLQIIFSAILIVLGPFAFAVSVLPAFQESYTRWIARYISVSLYAGIGYLVMALSMILIQYGLMKELALLDYILADDAAFMAYVVMSVGAANFYLIGLLIGGIAMLTIPVLSTWIITSGGVGHAVSSATRVAFSMGRSLIP
jgi:hypothetical protein